ADTTVVLEAPEMGDEVQAIKAGLLEVADIVVVNKGDRPGAQRTAAQLRAMLTAAARVGQEPSDRPRPKQPQVLVTTALAGEGVPALLTAIDALRPTGGQATVARATRAEAQVWGILADRLRLELARPELRPAADAVLAAVAAHELDPFSAADRLLGQLGRAAD
ncbi:MAG TPA: hypothetical protein VFP19_10260, partial [Candidatus Limnocylindrales bacterium]|nr:hypothetical protein [Candidatus Limnocylindrales bacterium]